MLSLEDLTPQAVLDSISKRELPLAQLTAERLTNLVRDDETLSAEVQDEETYRVELTCNGVSLYWRCTCGQPHPCEHLHALMLKWAFDRGEFSAPNREAPLAVTPVEPPPAQRPQQPPVWAAATFAERQNGYVGQLAHWLGSVRLQDLRLMARRRGWRVRGNDKTSVTRQVAEALAAPSANLQTALRLSEELQRALAALIVAGHSTNHQTVSRLAEKWAGLAQPRQFPNYLLRLRELGLAVPAEAIAYGPYADACPDVVARWLLPVVHRVLDRTQGASPVAGEQASASTEVRLADPLPFVRAAGEVALLLERSPVALRPPMPRPLLERQLPGLREWDYDPEELRRLHQSGKLRAQHDVVLTVPPPAPSLPDEAIARLAPVAGDAERLEFIYALLVASGVVMPGSPVTVWPEVKRQYFGRDEAAQRAILARAYFAMTEWSEVWGLWSSAKPALQIKRHTGYYGLPQGKLRADLARCRLAVVRALACLPDGEWLRAKDLYALLRALWPRFDEPPQQPATYYGPSSGWFLARPGSDSRFTPQSDEDWDLAQGRFVRRMLAGPLHWLGLADLRFEGGELAAFRLHGLADLYWDRVEAPPIRTCAPATPPGEAVRVEGNRIIVCPAAISAQAHGLLDEFTRLRSATSGRFEYELDAAAAYRAFQAGTALAEVLDGWQQLLPIPMPGAIRAQLVRWWEAYGSVRVYEGLSIIEFADDYALAEMKAVTSLAQHVVAQVTPRLVIVDAQAVPSLVAELKKAGYTPKQTDQV